MGPRQVQARQHFLGNGLGGDAVLETGARLVDPGTQQRQVEEHFGAVAIDQAQGLLLAAAGARFAVDDVAAGHGEGAGGHQRPLDLILQILDAGSHLAFRHSGQLGEHVIDDDIDLLRGGGGNGIRKGAAQLGAHRHLDRVRDARAVKGRQAAIPLAHQTANEPRVIGVGMSVGGEHARFLSQYHRSPPPPDHSSSSPFPRRVHQIGSLPAWRHVNATRRDLFAILRTDGCSTARGRLNGTLPHGPACQSDLRPGTARVSLRESERNPGTELLPRSS
ncbi:MAG: hypothetical protein R2853_16435 [Thermomicrobiales bacterium]